MNLPSVSVGKPVTTLMVFLGVMLVGLVCLTQLPVDLLPEMDLPAISVMTIYEGASPEDVETKVTEILERHLSTVPELKHIVSTSKEGVSSISLSFEWGANLDARANEVRDAVGLAKRQLPDDVEEPRVYKFNIAQFPIMMFGVTAEESYPRLEKILEDDVANPLKRLPGVGSVGVMVGIERQINVHLDRERLAAHNLTPQDVAQAIANENQTIPAGNIKTGLTDYLIRVPGEFKAVEPMQRIVLATHEERVVRLEDVALVADAFKEPSQYIRIDGGRAGMIVVQKQSEANTVDVAQQVRRRIEQLKRRLPPDIRIIKVMDNSEDIERTIHDLSQTLLLGGGLAMLVVLIFLRRVRATLVVGLAIPFSLIAAVVGVYLLGYTINMMTLFGLTIAVGMVVDNAIVILENVTRHGEEGERPREAAVYGSSEVAMAVTASTLTTICIFFPVIFVKGITKIIFSEFSVVVIVVLLGSLFSAITLTPMLCSRLLRPREGARRQGWLFRRSERWFDALSEAYGNLLGWALRHRVTVIVGAIAIFGLSLLLVPMIGSEFMPEEDRAMVQGTLHVAVGTRVEETDRVMRQVEDILRDEVKPEERVAAFTRCGVSAEGMSGVFGEAGTNIGTFGAKLVPKVKRRRTVQEIADVLRRRLEAIRGPARIDKFTIQTGDMMSGLIMGGGRPITINVIGDDMEVTDELAARIKRITEQTSGAVDVAVSRVKGKPQLWVQVDREKASALGLNLYGIADTIRTSFYGRTASKYRVHGDEYDIFVQLDEADRGRRTDLAATQVRLPGGRAIRVSDIADIGVRRGPLEIERKDQGRIVNVEGAVHERSLGEVVADIETRMAELDVPEGVEVIVSGQTEEQRESFLWLTIALGVGIVLVYMVMASQFESLRDPFIVMFSLPFAFVGVIWAIFLGGHNLSIVVFLGLLMLIGIVVNNAIVLVDYINILRARGLSVPDAVQQAGRTRLRPVLMTALTTICALMPMAFGSGQASEVWNPLGLTVLGGLLVSTLVTLLLVPTMYSLFERSGRARPREEHA